MNRQGILDSSEPECSHEGYIAEKHVYCPDCGDAGAEMLLQERIAELTSENARLREAQAGFLNLDELRTAMIDTADENVRLRDTIIYAKGRMKAYGIVDARIDLPGGWNEK